jgi:hypothetical protein
MKRCIYCNNEFDEMYFTDEHVIPKKIGGNLTPNNPFISKQVCRRCNSLCGKFIDAPFTKNWITSNNQAHVALKYIKFSPNIVLPLSYMGQVDNINYDGKICDFWFGPSGDLIYHFHAPYPDLEDVPPMVGITPQAKIEGYDPGIVFLFLRAKNSDWQSVVINSLINHFEDSTFYLGNGPKPNFDAFSEIPASLAALKERLIELTQDKLNLSFNTDTKYGDRFLAKLGLGLGSIFLNDDFVSSSSAALLRQFMWTRTVQDRATIPVSGSSFLSGGFDGILKHLLWPGGHFIMLLNDGPSLRLIVNFYESQPALVTVSNEPSHWKGIFKSKGMVYVISPSIQKYVGPISLIEFVEHRISEEKKSETLLEFEREIEQYIEKPPAAF